MPPLAQSRGGFFVAKSSKPPPGVELARMQRLA